MSKTLLQQHAAIALEEYAQQQQKLQADQQARDQEHQVQMQNQQAENAQAVLEVNRENALLKEEVQRLNGELRNQDADVLPAYEEAEVVGAAE